VQPEFAESNKNPQYVFHCRRTSFFNHDFHFVPFSFHFLNCMLLCTPSHHSDLPFSPPVCHHVIILHPISGCCVNHYYRVPVRVDPKATADVRAPDGEFGNKPSGGSFRRPFRNLDPPPPISNLNE
jgi:hypothetical protein